MNKIAGVYHSIPHFLLTALTIIAVLLLTLIPVPQQIVPDVNNIDKVVHFLMFGIIASITWLDVAHYRCTPPTWRQYICVAVASSLLGGAIEFLQGTEFINRSCDLYDFIADTAGAFILPPLLRPCLWRLLPTAQKVGLRTVARPTPELEHVYNESFPPEERRDWGNINRLASDTAHPLQFTEVLWLGKPVGLISWWNFGKWAYLEHFAVTSRLRGSGIGATALTKWLDMIAIPAVLEVELPGSNSMAPRRICFYERLGFIAHRNFSYIQPPYAPGLPSIPLILMTYGNIHNLDHVVSVLHTQVYGVNK